MDVLWVCSRFAYFLIQEDGYPHIRGDKEKLEECTAFSTVIDGIDIAHSSTILMAFAVYLSSFYVFNLAYPVVLKKTLTFFQRIILNIQDASKIDRSVVTLLDRFNQHLK